MDNFYLKKYLVENKVTTNSKVVNEDNNSQNSIEFLNRQLINNGVITNNDLKQATEMHKEEIAKSYDDAIMKGRHEDGYEYYEQTFGDNK